MCNAAAWLYLRLPRSRTNIIIGYLNAFGSGVMINVALVHMLAHSNEDLSRHLHGHIHWAFTIAGMGYGMLALTCGSLRAPPLSPSRH
jgi:zinc transporter ZupT